MPRVEWAIGLLAMLIAGCASDSPKPLEVEQPQAPEICERGEEMPVRAVERVAPHYPLMAATHYIEGYAVVRFTVAEDGRIVEPTVIESRPLGVFDREALDAVRQWKLQPAMRDCQPIRQEVTERMDFRLSRLSDSEVIGEGATDHMARTPSPTRPATIK